MGWPTKVERTVVVNDRRAGGPVRLEPGVWDLHPLDAARVIATGFARRAWLTDVDYDSPRSTLDLPKENG